MGQRAPRDRGLVVHELRLQACLGHLGPALEPFTLLATVDVQRGDLRLLHMEHGAVLAGALEDRDIVMVEVRLGESDHFRSGDLRHAVEVAHHVLPILAQDERIGERSSAQVVALVPIADLLLAFVVDHSGNEPVLELTFLQLVQFAQEQVPHFFQ